MPLKCVSDNRAGKGSKRGGHTRGKAARGASRAARGGSKRARSAEWMSDDDDEVRKASTFNFKWMSDDEEVRTASAVNILQIVCV